MSSRRRSLVAVGLAVAFMVAVAVAFGATGEDDSYISFDASAALARTGQLVSPNGDWVEQSTSVLWVILVALGHLASGLSIPTVGWLLALLGGGTTVVLSYLTVNRYNPRWALLGALSVGLITPLAYWSGGGMEITLASAAVLALGIFFDRSMQASKGSAVAVAFLIAAIFALRPELGIEVLLVGAAITAIFMLRRRSWRPSPALLGVLSGLALIATITVWRLLVFGIPMPQPVNAKSGVGFSFSWALNAGLPYLGQWLTEPWAVVAGTMLALLLAFTGVRRLAAGQNFLLMFGLLNMLVVASSRGDWMANGRLLVSGAVALVALLWSLVPHDAPRRLLVVGATVLLLVQGFSVYSTFRGVDQNLGSMVVDRWTIKVSENALKPSRDSYLVTSNARYFPNSYFIETITPVIAAAVDAKRAAGTLPLRVGSGDAGMAMYYLHERFGPDVQLVDQWQLAGRDFESCPGIETTSAGKYVSFEYWAANEGGCAPPLPDMIIDLEALQGDFGEKYTIVREVTATLDRIRGRRDFKQQLAVANVLLPQMGSHS